MGGQTCCVRKLCQVKKQSVCVHTGGAVVGAFVGLSVGSGVGVDVGPAVGVLLGLADGDAVGVPDGDAVGAAVGLAEGEVVGTGVGAREGRLAVMRWPGPSSLLKDVAPTISIPSLDKHIPTHCLGLASGSRLHVSPPSAVVYTNPPYTVATTRLPESEHASDDQLRMPASDRLTHVHPPSCDEKMCPEVAAAKITEPSADEQTVTQRCGAPTPFCSDHVTPPSCDV